MGRNLKKWGKTLEYGFSMIELKKIDSQGRVVLPPEWRKKIRSNEVFLVEDGDLLLVIPKDDPNLSKYFQFLKVEIPPDIYSDYHKLKDYLLSGGKV
jgi:bifunctional DNA-binding transcriptional regulator/antitoxin component of YhaV-PrlF toxin-antitoxin module